MQEANEEQKHEKDRSHLITEHSKSGREWMHLCKQLLSSSFLTLRNFETPLCGSRIVTILMNTPRTGNVSRSFLGLSMEGQPGSSPTPEV